MEGVAIRQLIALAEAEENNNASKWQDPASSSMRERPLLQRLSHTHATVIPVSLGCRGLAQRPKSCFPRTVGGEGPWWPVILMTKDCW